MLQVSALASPFSLCMIQSHIRPPLPVLHLYYSLYSNYHSCSDIRILGNNPVEKFEFNQQPADWPYAKLDMGKYRSEAAEWKDGWLVGIPHNFTTIAGDFTC